MEYALVIERIVTIAIFASVFITIISEKFDKTIVALLGATALLVFPDFWSGNHLKFGILTLPEAIAAIDFNTILLLFGMMVIVYIMRCAHIFSVTALYLARVTKGNPLYIFLVFCLITAVFSAFLDNVTTILVIVPITIQLTRGMGINPFFFILGEVFLSNIGGTATLIGDPPNILIGSAANLSFMEFLYMLWIPVVISTVLVIIYLVWTNWKEVRPCFDNFERLFTNNLMLQQIEHDAEQLKVDKKLMTRVLIVFGLTMVGFFTHAITHIEASVIALVGAVFLMIMTHKEFNIHKVLEHVEWGTLLFFVGLFIVVGGLKHAGILTMISDVIIHSSKDFTILLLIILWSSAFFSSVVDNIPFVAVMIPIVNDIVQSNTFNDGSDAMLLWWALSLGSCLGGNGTMIGASANVVAVEIARRDNIQITFTSFLRWSFPVIFITLMVSSVYLVILSS
jgi:Na+/H+ antiporter NhaD/arsenite permease-like protein